MPPSAQDAPGPDVLDLFDEAAGTTPGDALACRVCGCLVPRDGDYPRVHWDWHEAANGA